jgi:single-stranded DNA-binding protein
MSNNGTWVVNLGKDPEKLSLGGRDCYKLRCAEKAATKKAITRWFTAIVGGPDVDTASRLAEGNTIIVTGEMALTEYKAKKPRYKGEMIREDEIPFAKILRVVKSETFFADKTKSGEAPADEGAPTADAPEGDTPPDLSGLD